MARTWLNPRCLMTARAWPAGGKLGLGFFGLTQPLMPGTDGDSQSDWNLGQIQKAKSNADKVGPA